MLQEMVKEILQAGKYNGRQKVGSTQRHAAKLVDLEV
jgi:hypothetical protein